MVPDMKPNRLNQSIIRSIVRKSITQLKENPEREVRNLIDLGDMFARGEFQKMFFGSAREELEKDTSAYYDVALQVIQSTDTDNLLSFGMNLGYNGLSHGATQIRTYEERGGFNIPWVIFACIRGGTHTFGPEALDSLVRQGRALGIYSYVLLPSDDADLSSYLNIVGKYSDCAFFLMLSPAAVRGRRIITELVRHRNILVGLDISDGGRDSAAEAADLLHGNKIFCSAFVRIPSGKYDIEKHTAAAHAHGFNLLLTLTGIETAFQDEKRIAETVGAWRVNLSRPVIPFDLLSDATMVDRSISSEGCIVSVDGDGMLSVVNMESGERKSGYSTLKDTLVSILQSALPKLRPTGPSSSRIGPAI